MTQLGVQTPGVLRGGGAAYLCMETEDGSLE